MPTYVTNALRGCLFVLAGGFAAQHSRLPLSADLCTLLFIAVVVIFVFRHLRWFALLLLGFTLFMQAGNGIIDARLDVRFAGDSLLTQVRISGFPKVHGSAVSMLVEPINDARVPRRSRISWFEPPQIPVAGEIWELELRLRRPRGNANPGVFRLEDWMFREELHATGYVVAGKRNRIIKSDRLSWIESYKLDFVSRVQRSGSPSAPVLAAIGVGTRHLISPDDWDRYAITGTSHLMAISGLHVGIVGMFAFAVMVIVFGTLRLPGNYLDYATIFAVGAAAAYAFISGLAVPSQRATIMFGLAAAAYLGRRRPEPMRMLGMVALLIFVSNPISLMMPGFKLSFAAVVVLLWFANGYWRATTGKRLVQLTVMQCTLLLGLMPLTILIFQRVAVVAPLVNIITVPVFSLVTVPFMIASMVLYPLSVSASDFLLDTSAASIQLIQRLINEFAQLPFSDVYISGVAGFSGTIACIVLLPVLWVVLPRGWPGRWVAMLAVISLLVYQPATPPRRCFDTHVLDVGQGLAVVVQTQQKTLVFDTGPSYRNNGSAATAVVLPFLRYKGISKLDWLVISHSDDDHAGGLPDFERSIETGRVFVGETLRNGKVDTNKCVAGQAWQADGVEFAFVHPGAGHIRSGNDSSCVLTISAGSHRLVLTGDIEKEGERLALTRMQQKGSTVVVIPHHGSLTSSSPLFVNHLRPEIAIASAGYANRWGFPKERVTRRWEGVGATVLDTGRSGAISFRLCANGGATRMREERVWHRRFWHDLASH